MWGVVLKKYISRPGTVLEKRKDANVLEKSWKLKKYTMKLELSLFLEEIDDHKAKR